MNLRRCKENVNPRKVATVKRQKIDADCNEVVKKPLTISDNKTPGQQDGNPAKKGKPNAGKEKKSKTKADVTGKSGAIRQNASNAKDDGDTKKRNQKIKAIPKRPEKPLKLTENFEFKKPSSVRKAIKRKPVSSSDEESVSATITRNSSNQCTTSDFLEAVKHAFGFADESDNYLNNLAHKLKCKTHLTAFDPSKPYRLALYVHPCQTRPANPNQLVQQTRKMAPSTNFSNISTISMLSPIRNTHFPVTASTPKEKQKRKFIQTKITDSLQGASRTKPSRNATIFSDSPSSDEENASKLQTTVKSNDNTTFSETQTSLGSTSDDTDKELISVRRNTRRSYVKRLKVVPEPVDDEPSTDDVLKQLEKSKKKKKTKPKADKDFEAWSKSINSEFDEIEKFEISFD